MVCCSVCCDCLVKGRVRSWLKTRGLFTFSSFVRVLVSARIRVLPLFWVRARVVGLYAQHVCCYSKKTIQYRNNGGLFVLVWSLMQSARAQVLLFSVLMRGPLYPTGSMLLHYSFLFLVYFWRWYGDF